MSQKSSRPKKLKPNDVPLDFNRCAPEEDECRLIILKVVEQAVRDYIALEKSESLSDQQEYELVKEFLFDDEYIIDWGGANLSLQDLLDWVGLEVEWVREKAIKAKVRKLKRFSMKKALIEKLEK